MSIQRITSGNRTPAERYAQLFAQLYGLEGGGFAQVSATRDQDVPLRTVFEIERNRDRVLSRNARLADATILLRRSIRTTANDRRIRDSLPARTVLLELALKQPDWKERAQAFFKAHPNLQTLHLSGHFPLYRQDDAPNVGAFVDSVLATPFELAHPGDPDQTVLPDSLPAQTLGQLCERFPTQFRTMSAVHFTIPSGWLAIFADLCEQIDRQLSNSERAAFHWVQIRRRDHGLTCCYGLQAPLTASQGAGAESFDWEHLGIAVMKQVRKAEAQAATTCEFCGKAGRPHRRGIPYWLCDDHARPGWNPLPAFRAWRLR